jgi:hypothetical protein
MVEQNGKRIRSIAIEFLKYLIGVGFIMNLTNDLKGLLFHGDIFIYKIIF